MNFGKALELMKSGNKLSRKGWNGKNMFAVYQNNNEFWKSTRINEKWQ
ncbi:Thoeris anti-defense Tad2 family protein [Bacillus thuringiensis]|nr:MW1434 family type I TA system toxin [Bacillus thuringiensis]